jgi:hypothetical protein
MYTCIYIYIYIYMYTNIYIIYTYIYIYICICKYLYIYNIYIFTYVLISSLGLQQKADILIKFDTNLLSDISPIQSAVQCMLVDEVYKYIYV